MDSKPYLTVDKFVEKFVKTLLDAQPKARFNPKLLCPTILLIWIRGLNGTESKSILESGIGPSSVCDGIQTKLDGYKRNPHHVMTAQLYETLKLSAKLINNRQEFSKVNSKRWLIPVPIGDCVKLDWYDIKAPDSKNLYEGKKDTNLIQFFSQVDAFKGDRVSQMYFIHQLTKCIDTIQIGIRSGAMEQGMYMGVPTIYLEEKDSPSGERMASLATDLLPKGSLATGNKMLSPNKFGMFFRLKTKHLIGLNQARTLKEIEEIHNWLIERTSTQLGTRAAKGTLTRDEFDMLNYNLAEICNNLKSYQSMLQKDKKS